MSVSWRSPFQKLPQEEAGRDLGKELAGQLWGQRLSPARGSREWATRARDPAPGAAQREGAVSGRSRAPVEGTERQEKVTARTASVAEVLQRAGGAGQGPGLSSVAVKVASLTQAGEVAALISINVVMRTK